MKVAILSALRTPFARAIKGELKDTRPDTMAAHVIRAAVDAVPGLSGSRVEDVILGCAMPEAEQGMNVARPAAVLAGLPNEVSAVTINRFCSSGIQSMAMAAQAIHAGLQSVVVAGGTESMSMVPMGGIKFSANPEILDKYPAIYMGMGNTAEEVAARFDVPRAAQDAFALESQQRAKAAQDAGRLSDEITPIDVVWYDDDGVAQRTTLSKDTILRPETTLEGLNGLKAVFKANGTVTAGNASPLTDGAAAAVMASDAVVAELGVKPLGYLRDFVVTGVDPDIMGIGPVPAVRKLLARNGLTVADIEVFELNEAFAAQSLYCIRELGLDPSRVNPNGGAIALGHPLGVSGTRMAATLLRELKRRQAGKLGVVTMCIGGGMGAAALIEAEL